VATSRRHLKIRWQQRFYQFAPSAGLVHSGIVNPPDAQEPSPSRKATVNYQAFIVLAGLALLLLGIFFNHGGQGCLWLVPVVVVIPYNLAGGRPTGE